ncbi:MULTISPECIES: benzoate 1,2-dioxygenase electron transfer component BenC [Paraburkholderia]|jgi:benzoate/toluate 1,2-dioxygenase reductase component|uniref:benzoate 1,2-dioxygenase electron transfer component BenC n=1 Tax=Paraburkholderia TaxID=1822464 RepID=UPI00190D7F78|nr:MULTISPECIES: benzoate 1,2-dioxygenase electron transfer component BenC [Paraburkholderia]MCP2084587.1 benzoate/toluate 1,2-dioxygenase reductase subunit [Paraburkholderia sediminicola]MBK3839385.1 ring-hydroxylating dioxygenase ferredoxin reductase family protein [Paraburkholderia aspalathi]MCX4138064.1 benzoate 1,2-dioxygenase electron transfer component BenC [Paraburkholderia aspalathi]MDN7170755.1 ring-hydroxylating dioxygenase ferredoxin reductase family protein [Paraburkholderia sp. SE
MSTYNIALNFEDGVTRFVACKPGEKVLDAAFRAKINLPMDCSDGVCGTCKCRAESGSYDLGDDYIEDALSDDEKDSGLVLTCQMVPQSDCVIAVPASSTACKTEQSRFAATVSKVEPHNDAAVVLELDVDATAPVFLAGQYVNIDVPGSGQHRSYSFSSAPGQSKVSFLIKRIPGGVMSTWLDSAQPGNKLELIGPLGSFYLRAVERPLLFLAGGTGLAPFLSMLEVLARTDSQQKVHLIYGVTRDLDLVQVDAIEAYVAKLPNFTYATVVADTDSTHPRKGWVTQHMPAEALNDGDVDVYLCGPPPMVDAVRKHFDDNGVKPNSFHYEKFTPNAAPRTA